MGKVDFTSGDRDRTLEMIYVEGINVRDPNKKMALGIHYVEKIIELIKKSTEITEGEKDNVLNLLREETLYAKIVKTRHGSGETFLSELKMNLYGILPKEDREKSYAKILLLILSNAQSTTLAEFIIPVASRLKATPRKTTYKIQVETARKANLTTHTVEIAAIDLKNLVHREALANAYLEKVREKLKNCSTVVDKGKNDALSLITPAVLADKIAKIIEEGCSDARALCRKLGVGLTMVLYDGGADTRLFSIFTKAGNEALDGKAILQIPPFTPLVMSFDELDLAVDASPLVSLQMPKPSAVTEPAPAAESGTTPAEPSPVAQAEQPGISQIEAQEGVLFDVSSKEQRAAIVKKVLEALVEANINTDATASDILNDMPGTEATAEIFFVELELALGAILNIRRNEEKRGIIARVVMQFLKKYDKPVEEDAGEQMLLTHAELLSDSNDNNDTPVLKGKMLVRTDDPEVQEFIEKCFSKYAELPLDSNDNDAIRAFIEKNIPVLRGKMLVRTDDPEVQEFIEKCFSKLGSDLESNLERKKSHEVFVYDSVVRHLADLVIKTLPGNLIEDTTEDRAALIIEDEIEKMANFYGITDIFDENVSSRKSLRVQCLQADTPSVNVPKLEQLPGDLVSGLITVEVEEASIPTSEVATSMIPAEPEPEPESESRPISEKPIAASARTHAVPYNLPEAVEPAMIVMVYEDATPLSLTMSAIVDQKPPLSEKTAILAKQFGASSPRIALSFGRPSRKSVARMPRWALTIPAVVAFASVIKYFVPADTGINNQVSQGIAVAASPATTAAPETITNDPKLTEEIGNSIGEMQKDLAVNLLSSSDTPNRRRLLGNIIRVSNLLITDKVFRERVKAGADIKTEAQRFLQEYFQYCSQNELFEVEQAEVLSFF